MYPNATTAATPGGFGSSLDRSTATGRGADAARVCAFRVAWRAEDVMLQRVPRAKVKIIIHPPLENVCVPGGRLKEALALSSSHGREHHSRITLATKIQTTFSRLAGTHHLHEPTNGSTRLK